MKKRSLLFLSFACGCFPLLAADPFPAFEKLDSSTLFPRDGVVTVSPEGHFLANGKPRYFPSTIYYEGTLGTFSTHTAGYPEELNWLYEAGLDYEGYQRLGLDFTGLNTNAAWLKKYRPKQWTFAESDEGNRRTLAAGIPVYIDFTCAPWSHGGLRYKEGVPPEKDAFAVEGRGNHHWLPYSLNTESGRALYRDMWAGGVAGILAQGGKPLVYELFNEPDYNDWSEFNRKLFSARLKERYKGDIAALNAAWHTDYTDFESIGQFKFQNQNPALAVEWTKFMEQSFTGVCDFGLKVLKEADPRAGVLYCVQPINAKFSNLDNFEVNRRMNAICTATGGGSAVNAKEYLAMADGKPIFDGETYLGATAPRIRSKLLLQYARGLNASFAFKWSRRPFDELWRNHDAEGGRKVAEKFPYLLLNPYAVPTDALSGIRQAKEDILKIGHLFTPRNRGVKSEVALLYSLPTRRLARAQGTTSYNLYYLYGHALEYSFLPYDVVFEPQIAERAARYKAIFAPGVATVEPETLAQLRKYVEDGGTLVLAGEAMQLDIYGKVRSDNDFPGLTPTGELHGKSETLRFGSSSFAAEAERQITASEGWKPAAVLGGAPAILRRSFGRGEVVYCNVKMPGDATAAFLRAIAAEKAVRPVAKIVDAATGEPVYEVELHKAVRDGETGYLFFNSGFSGKKVFLMPSAAPGEVCADPFDGKVLEAKDGRIPLYLAPQDAHMVVQGPREALEKRYGKLAETAFDAADKAADDAVARESAGRKKETKAFHVPYERQKTIDLRDKANSSYLDRVEGDEKGGWTDQGANSLRNVPWEVTDCNGILIDFIRPDMNGERSCIVMGSTRLAFGPKEIKGIRVDSPAEKLYFLHGVAWPQDGVPAFSYLIHYGDNTTLEIPIRGNIEVTDWYRMSQTLPNQKAVMGWRNQENRGLWLYEWTNPAPEKTIASIDIVSKWTGTISMIGGITAELPVPDRPDSLLRFHPRNFLFHAWGRAIPSVLSGNAVEIRLNDKSTDWCGTNIELRKPVPVPEKPADFRLEFEWNGALDAWGRPRGQHSFQLRLLGVNRAGGGTRGAQVPGSQYGGALDEDPDTWQRVAIPLERLTTKDMAEIRQIQVQFRRLGEERSGVQLRNFRLVPVEKVSENKD